MNPTLPMISQEQQTILSIGGVGALVGVFQLLVAREKVTWGYAIGRAGLNAAYAVGALSLTTFLPSLGVEAKFGLACVLASLGTTGTERLFNAILDRVRGSAAATSEPAAPAPKE